MIKEIRVKPLEADNKEGKIMAYIFFFQPILCVIVASFIIYMNKELFRLDLVAQIAIGVFILLAISAFFTNMPNIANNVLAEEVCYIKNKIFYYTKTRNFFGIKKVIKSFEIPIAEISDIRENKEKIKVNIFSIFKARNSLEIETREGKKYSIMNDFHLSGKHSQDDMKIETREERAKRIFNEVKELVMEAKNMNTFNF